jgi:hypothetical protein
MPGVDRSWLGAEPIRQPMKKTKQQKRARDLTPMAVAIATLTGAAALYCGEIIYDNIKDSGAPDMRQLPGWRAHMASACVGTLAFVISFFLLESLSRRSKGSALRSTVPWLPVVALTGLATAIHIPTYMVALLIALYSPWAYLYSRQARQRLYLTDRSLRRKTYR